MVSNRKRANRSLGNLVNNLDSKVSKNAKKVLDVKRRQALSVKAEDLAPAGVTDEKVAPGAVGSDTMGVVNELKADYNLVAKVPEKMVLDGPEYKDKAPAANFLSVQTDGSIVTRTVDWNTVDGKPSSYPSSTHTHNASDVDSGTLNNARLASDVWRVRPGGQADWNSYVESGNISVSNANTATNGPGASAYQWGILTVSASGTVVAQIYITHQEPPEFWFRLKYNATDWRSWQRAASRAELDALINPTASMTLGRLKLTLADDVSLTSTVAALQIGEETATHMIFDGNEIMARTAAGTANDLYLTNPRLTGDSTNFTSGDHLAPKSYVDGAFLDGRSVEFGHVDATGEFRSPDTAVLRGVVGSTTPYLAVGNDGTNRVWSEGVYSRTTSGATNMHVTAGGTLARSTSAKKYKLAIEASPDDWGQKLLGIKARTWFDRAASEHYADLLTRESEGEEIDWSVHDVTPIRRFPGFIAEELEAAGLSDFLVYGEDGQLEEIQYDRLTAALLQIAQSQDQRIAKLEERLNALVPDPIPTPTPTPVPAPIPPGKKTPRE